MHAAIRQILLQAAASHFLGSELMLPRPGCHPRFCYCQLIAVTLAFERRWQPAPSAAALISETFDRLCLYLAR